MKGSGERREGRGEGKGRGYGKREEGDYRAAKNICASAQLSTFWEPHADYLMTCSVMQINVVASLRAFKVATCLLL